MDFKIRVLRYFVTVARVSSVTKAAEILYVAQPSLSQRIRSFEEQLGFSLFERSHGYMSLSEEGKQFLPVAEKLVETADLAGITVRNLRDGQAGTIRVGGSWYVLERYECQSLVYQFADEYPGVELMVDRSSYSPQLLTRLKHKELDVAFVVGSVDSPGFEYLKLTPMVFDLLIPEEWPQSEKSVLLHEDLRGMKIGWYRRENNPYIYDLTNKFLTSCSAEIFTPPDTHLSALASFAQRTRAATFVGRETTSIAFDDMVKLPIANDPISFELSLVCLDEKRSEIVERYWLYAKNLITDTRDDF